MALIYIYGIKKSDGSVKTKKKNVDDNPWPAEEISHTIIIPPNLHPSSSNGHDESEKDIQELCCESLLNIDKKAKQRNRLNCSALPQTDAESNAEGLDGGEQIAGIVVECSAFPKNESKQGQEEASIFRLKISTYYAYQTKAEETSYISLPKKDKRSVGSTKVCIECIECNPMIKELKKFIVNRPKTTSKNVEDECDHLVEEVLAAKSGRKVEQVIYEFSRNLHHESYLHSFIINDADATTSNEEWEEITSSEIKPKPKLERSQLELLKKYTFDNIKDL
ncbi:hypothetical protein RhiirA4_541655 [Rhizophagus irregularis]|uniref:Uncharacterized protein n=1 Tax=Rhizophagus irregularis TaxID=588596 RepID=A0A2I1GC33_9GLOM|nr:hypothetical protein RhiirA4_541655 [Rhizophagus irregularis]